LHESREVLEYWNRDDVESMYDKHLVSVEIELIKQRIASNSKILDAGCGEGEGTLAYSSIPGIKVHAADLSETRIKKAAERLKKCNNVILKKVDFLGQYCLDDDYDSVISQRFLTNLVGWELQKKVLLKLMAMLKPGGRLLMLEGSKQGAESLNKLRAVLGLEPIPVKWHNVFFDDDALLDFMWQNHYELVEEDGLGAYFFLTRGIRPCFDKELNWDCEFNRMAASKATRDVLGITTMFAKLKLWVFEE